MSMHLVAVEDDKRGTVFSKLVHTGFEIHGWNAEGVFRVNLTREEAQDVENIHGVLSVSIEPEREVQSFD